MKNNGEDQKDNPQTHAVVNVLEEIKALLVLLLMKSGTTQTEIAKALGTTQATVSRQFRLGAVKPLEVAVVNSGNRQEAQHG